MLIDFMINVFKKNLDKDAIIWNERIYSYEWLVNRFQYWQSKIVSEGISPGTVTIIEADFSANSVALFLALTDLGCILVPLTGSVKEKKNEFIKIAQGEYSLIIDDNDNVEVSKLPYSAYHKLYDQLKQSNHSGLVLFSSGSTGKSKAAVHDLTGILEKFKITRHSLRAITFLLYDHIGGINTMLYLLANAGCIVAVKDRNPDYVLDTVDKYNVELLPTSPSFINLVLLGEAYKRYTLKSLKTVTYGTEPMPEVTLKRFHKLFPKIRLQQTYGLSEVGILRSKSKRSNSLWVKVGGEGFETRVVNGMLQIKAKSAMLGYLNAPSPFTHDGWFDTGDSVAVEGEYIKILGRKSEIINVGGEKVYPSEVENVIQEIKNVGEVTAYGERNPILGKIVCAKVRLLTDEDPKTFKKRLKHYCSQKLEKFKVPVKVEIVSEKQHSDRFKKIRYRQLG
jgi:acyl-CoA synthetase (AMP-forming)/AMP-acid ligase II